MVKFLKILLDLITYKRKIIEVEQIHNSELVERLKSVVYREELNELVNDPVSKICVINTYTPTLDDLVSCLISPRGNNTLIAVNLHSYFKKNTNKFTFMIKRIIPIIEKQKISVTLIHDLNEVLDTLDYLTTLKGKTK